MKKLFTVDAIMAAIVSSIGYGAGYVIPHNFGANAFLTGVICSVVGTICDRVGSKLIYNSYTQKSVGRKCMVYAGIVLVFFVAGCIIEKYFGYSILFDLSDNLFFVIGIPVVAFCFSFGIRIIKGKRLYKKYGNGEEGFIIDQKALKSLKKLKGENLKLSEYTGKNPVAKTSSGIYVGKKSRNCVSFLGIPYAKANRWEKAEPLENSQEIFEAYYFGSSEIQPDSIHNVLTNFSQNEDCLSLNIWTSKYEPNSKKPVLVYFHGGDGRYGGSANPAYHLENIAKGIPDAVFVSVNYRFGVFGVVDFSSSGLPDSDEYKESTFLSLLDQIEALKWIKNNISAFGGNPENITVAGDTSGGTDVCLLASAKDAKGLFKRAIIMCASVFDAQENDEKASLLGKKLIEEFDAKSVSDLKKITSEELSEFSAKYYDLIELPARNSSFISENIGKEYLNGAASDIEFIFGIAADDISGWQAMLAGDVSLDEMAKTYFEVLKRAFGENESDKLEKLLETYMKNGLDETQAKTYLLSDFQFKACMLYNCVLLAKGGSKVRCFLWDVSGGIEKFTANSASMVTSILGNLDIAEQLGYLHDKGITQIMQAMINKFVHGQEPSFFNNEIKGVNEISWSEFTPEKKGVLHITNGKIQMSENAFSENVMELEKIIPSREK